MRSIHTRDKRKRRPFVETAIAALAMEPDKIPRLPGFSADQLSMIASALAGQQPLCCVVGADARETITEVQADELAKFANTCTGCQLEKRAPKERGAFTDRYLARFIVAIGAAS